MKILKIILKIILLPIGITFVTCFALTMFVFHIYTSFVWILFGLKKSKIQTIKLKTIFNKYIDRKLMTTEEALTKLNELK